MYNIELFLECYLYGYLNRINPLNMKRVLKEIDDYLGCYFIRKDLFCSPERLKSSAATIKKFYKCMLAHNRIEKEEYAQLCEIIKQNLPQWIAIWEEYDETGWSSEWYCS